MLHSILRIPRVWSRYRLHALHPSLPLPVLHRFTGATVSILDGHQCVPPSHCLLVLSGPASLSGRSLQGCVKLYFLACTVALASLTLPPALALALALTLPALALPMAVAR